MKIREFENKFSNFQIFQIFKFLYVLPHRIWAQISINWLQAENYWLGGVEIPHSKGALGHSDADVLLHAICDALLGALNLGDIGIHFPDTDKNLKDIDSKILLEKTFRLIREKGYPDC